MIVETKQLKNKELEEIKTTQFFIFFDSSPLGMIISKNLKSQPFEMCLKIKAFNEISN